MRSPLEQFTVTPRCIGLILDAREKFMASMLLSHDKRRGIVVPDAEEWFGLNKLALDDQLKPKEKKDG